MKPTMKPKDFQGLRHVPILGNCHPENECIVGNDYAVWVIFPAPILGILGILGKSTPENGRPLEFQGDRSFSGVFTRAHARGLISGGGHQ